MRSSTSTASTAAPESEARGAATRCSRSSRTSAATTASTRSTTPRSRNRQNATTGQLVARHLRRAVQILERVDFSTAAVRDDLGGPRTAPRYLFAAAELINHAADLSAASAVLVHENERRWRVFHERVAEIERGA